MKTTLKLLIFTYLLFLSACLSGKKSNVTTVAAATASGGVNKWSSSSLGANGLDLKISTALVSDFHGGDFDSNGRNPAEQMALNWNGVIGGVKFFRVPMNTTANTQYANISEYGSDNVLGIYKHTNWFNNVDAQALAVTQFLGVRRNPGTSGEFLELVHADIIFNYKNWSFSTNPNDIFNFDFYSVVLHELGHFIGLKHQVDPSIPSVMEPAINSASVKRTLMANDYNTLRHNYSVSALNSSSLILGSISNSSGSGSNSNKAKTDLKKVDPNLVVRGVIELRANGECHHYEDGKLIEKHKVDPEQFTFSKHH